MSIEQARRKKSEGIVQRRTLLDKTGVSTALRTVAQKILERHPDPKKLVLIGIRTGGAFLAERLRALMKSQINVDVPCGAMDITLYRDDAYSSLQRPEVGPPDLPVSIHGKVVVLVDDVLFTGRTIRAALDELMDFGRPQKVELAVLVDRGHRELPSQADYVGLTVETSLEQSVRVMLQELGEADEVVLCERARS